MPSFYFSSVLYTLVYLHTLVHTAEVNLSYNIILEYNFGKLHCVQKLLVKDAHELEYKEILLCILRLFGSSINLIFLWIISRAASRGPRT